MALPVARLSVLEATQCLQSQTPVVVGLRGCAVQLDRSIQALQSRLGLPQS